MKNQSLVILILLSFFFIACKKEEMTLGKDGLNSDIFLNSDAIDTFQLETYTVEEDSLISSNLPVAILGSYNDPEFGTFKSEFYTQFHLSGLNPNFGNLATIAIDSFVLGLEYKGHYGNLNPQRFEVFELSENLYLDSTYYSFQKKATKTTNLILANHDIIIPDPSSQTIIGTEKVKSQLRIFLDTNFARSMMVEAATNNGNFSTNDKFLSYFKGLNVRVNNPSQNSGEGGIFYFNLNAPLSKLTIYYRKSGEKKTFDFLINDACADFNHIEVDHTGKNIADVILNPSLGQKTFYAQANKARAIVKFKTIDNIPKNSVIQYAKLEIPVSYYSGDVLYPSSTISIATKISSTDNKLYNLNVTGEYSKTSKSYIIDVRDYVQKIVTGKIENLGVYLSPAKMLTSAERIIFNGPLSENKKQPKLHIIYTEY